MPTNIFPAYLLLGEEDFLKEEFVNRLRAQCLDKNTEQLNYSVFYARDKDFDIEIMFDTLNTSPFLSKKRLVVLKDADELGAHFKKLIISYLKEPKEDSVFVIESLEPSIKGEFLLEASRLAHLINCRRLTDSGLDSWLVKKAGLFGKRLTRDAIITLKENLPNDLRTISSTMDNIILFVGKKALITKADVDAVIGANPLHTAFDLIDILEKKDARKALRIFSFIKADRKREIELIGLMAKNLRMIFRIKELSRVKTKTELQKILGLYSKYFERLYNYASRFEKKRILKLLDEILKADLAIKTGWDPTFIMEQLIVKMCQ